MSRKGDCWSNAVVKRFFGTLNTEQVVFTEYRARTGAKRDIINCSQRLSYNWAVFKDLLKQFFNTCAEDN
jgi:transposase InsO family protein